MDPPDILPTSLTLFLQMMYQGVLSDDERRKEKMRQRQEDFERSREKRRIYEAVQKVEKADS